jgi:hypothetical protein
MLADKTLLSVTLAATFASGCFVGLAARGGKGGAGVPPNDPAVIYAPQLEALEAEGYDEAEMAKARQVYAELYKGYEYWWNAFLDTHRANTDIIDKKFEKARDALQAEHKARVGAK